MEAITREEKLLDGQELEPITRKEQFIKKIYDNTQVTPEPITREEYFLKKAGESGGGGSVTVEQLNVTENGEYSESGKAYSPVIVEVPTPTPTQIESLSVTENGTYNESGKAYNPVIVNVPTSSVTYKVATGTFVSASEQYGIVDVDCGFEPDMVLVSLPFDNVDTTSYWERNVSWGDDYACWNLWPAEGTVFFVELDRESGETGIQAINSDGFSFMSNGWNTQGVTCTYTAVKYTGAPVLDLIYTLQAGGQWETFTLPSGVTELIVVVDNETDGLKEEIRVPVSYLATYDGYNYTNVGQINYGAYNESLGINMAKDGSTIYVSMMYPVPQGYDISLQVYKEG